MIWCRGVILPDHALQISVLDRALEHGLGLFETFRTWQGRPVLLDRHLERMSRSAHALGLTLEPVPLPDSRAVFDLIDANRESLPVGHDVRLRLTLSGGRSTPQDGGSVLWMTAGPLPPPARLSGAIIDQTIRVSQDDVLARHKSLNYWHNRIAHAQATAAGSDDVLCVTDAGLICETSRANIFLVEGRQLSTPGLSGLLLPGVMRGVVVERAAEMGLDVLEGPLPVDRIKAADEAFMTSSLRGILPVARLVGRELPAPGPVTRRLWEATLSWLNSGGTTP
jgi:branched-subunit amino acid aminotransferase/4-amino-4-deoxychorismate lyase